MSVPKGGGIQAIPVPQGRGIGYASEWVARSISVGPNGVPWILGCTGGDPNGTGPAWVYYLTWSNPPGSLSPVYQWNYDYFSAMTLSVNLQGTPNVTDVNGVVWAETANNGSYDTGYLTEPSGVWVAISNGGAGAITAGVPRSVPGTKIGEMFYPSRLYPYSTRGRNGQRGRLGHLLYHAL